MTLIFVFESILFIAATLLSHDDITLKAIIITAVYRISTETFVLSSYTAKILRK